MGADLLSLCLGWMALTQTTAGVLYFASSGLITLAVLTVGKTPDCVGIPSSEECTTDHYLPLNLRCVAAWCGLWKFALSKNPAVREILGLDDRERRHRD